MCVCRVYVYLCAAHHYTVAPRRPTNPQAIAQARQDLLSSSLSSSRIYLSISVNSPALLLVVLHLSAGKSLHVIQLATFRATQRTSGHQVSDSTFKVDAFLIHRSRQF